jgi:hypothetical protein
MGLTIPSVASESLGAIDGMALGAGSAQEQPEPFAFLLAALVGDVPAPVTKLLNLRGLSAEAVALPSQEPEEHPAPESPKDTTFDDAARPLVDLAHLVFLATNFPAALPPMKTSGALTQSAEPIEGSSQERTKEAQGLPESAQTPVGSQLETTSIAVVVASGDPATNAAARPDVAPPISFQAIAGSDSLRGFTPWIEEPAFEPPSPLTAPGNDHTVILPTFPIAMDSQPEAAIPSSFDPWTPAPIEFEPNTTPTEATPPGGQTPPTERAVGAFQASAPAPNETQMGLASVPATMRREPVFAEGASTPLDRVGDVSSVPDVVPKREPQDRDDTESPPESQGHDTSGVVRSVGNTQPPSITGVPVHSTGARATRIQSPRASTNSIVPLPGRAGDVQADAVAAPEQPAPVEIPDLPPAIQQVTRAVIERVAEGGGEARLHLEPAGLGEVTIRIEASGLDVTIDVQADRPEAMQLLRNHAVDLASLLGERGLNLTDVSVGLGQRHGQGSQPEPGSRDRQEQGGFASLLEIDTAEPIERHNRLRAAYNPDGALSYRV